MEKGSERWRNRGKSRFPHQEPGSRGQEAKPKQKQRLGVPDLTWSVDILVFTSKIGAVNSIEEHVLFARLENY